MAAGTINKVILIGNLGDEVKMHYFDDQNCVGRFPIATSESYTNKQTGEKITNTDWHNIVVRNGLAKVCEKYIGKGDKVYVEGKLKNRQWEQDGVKRYSTEVHVNEMTMLSTKKNTVNPNNLQQNQPTSSPETKTVAPEENDDLPF
ncbi:single-stranded DNA-binding protein [Polaribacter reichenbachii]|uniref:Single-stranded DNA-binding protein n=1 Tax=Polaribacter reichenbachii TaxID=996801 RepID=A0A1B8U614_9FLAO|nr:single-stranded DNA-binding protein [Polaribacter reichenbachii]APZ46014.1 single-stranded DNA-binding protein [Polaribacter reichenbachii]AUC19876.1 single-stranded DNA-binding protein [Polaribacter reichenbachii]OBY67269.1 single-stranded DNA-binding protein [Polaribacter reichenbachii]